MLYTAIRLMRCVCFPDLQQLHSLSQLEWVNDWEGWAEVKDKLRACDDDAVMRCAIEYFVLVFVNLCQSMLSFKTLQVMRLGAKI